MIARILTLALVFTTLFSLDAAQTEAPQPLPANALLSSQGNDYYVGAVNHNTIPMSAYSIEVVLFGDGSIKRHFYDARISGREPIKTAERKQEFYPTPVIRVKLLAAVFTDGSTFGDANQVGDLMERRQMKLRALSDITEVFCEAEVHTANLQAVIDSLEQRSRTAVTGERSTADAVARNQYQDTINELKRKNSVEAGVLAPMRIRLATVGARLAQDPVKDSSGQLYIPDPTARLTCGQQPLPAPRSAPTLTAEAPPLRRSAPELEDVPSTGLPKTMRFCGPSHCGTLNRVGGHFEAFYDDGTGPSNYVVEQFTAEAIRINRIDSDGARAVLTGRLSPDGYRVLDGKITWIFGRKGTFPITLAWGGAIYVPNSNQQIPPSTQAPGFGGQAPIDDIYSVGGDVSAPRPLMKPEPDYTDEARRAQFRGTVDVAVVIDERGRPVDVRVQHPVGYGLDESVVEGIKKWIFSPAMKAGQPIRVRIYVHINFQP